MASHTAAVFGAFVVLLAAFASPAVAQGNIAALLTRPELQPFITAVIGIQECITDPGLMSFNLDECKSLLTMLDAINLGNASPPVTPCEMACVQQFAKLSATCVGELRDTFSGMDNNLGTLGTQWFETCDDLTKIPEAAGGPTMAPSTAPMPAPMPEEAPAPAPVAAVEAAAPAGSPVMSGSVASALSSGLLALLAAAAYLVL